MRCLARSPEKLQSRTWVSDPKVETCRWQSQDEGQLTRNLSRCDAAYYLVHSMMSGTEYVERDRQLALSFARAARNARLPRIIYLGGLGETGPRLSKHLASRRQVEEALASTGVPLTVLRAAMIIGSGSASFEILRYLVERLPVMVTPKWVATPCQPIAVRNVIVYLLGVLDHPETAGQVFDIGSPEVLCYRDIMHLMAEELHLRQRFVIPVPVLTPRLSSYWIQFITPLSHEIAQPLTEGLKNPVVCRDRRITELIPQDLLTIREAIRVALQHSEQHTVETRWSMAGPIPGDPDWAGGTVFRDVQSANMPAPDWAVYRAVCRVGGGHGWYAADSLWKIRGWLDHMVGGPGLRRGRRDPETVEFGEALDFWRVVGLERNRRLALRAEMKLPGEALLEFEIEPRGEHHCVLRQSALFKPRGLFGLLYWYMSLPLHAIVFHGMMRGILKEAATIAEAHAAPGLRKRA